MVIKADGKIVIPYSGPKAGKIVEHFPPSDKDLMFFCWGLHHRNRYPHMVITLDKGSAVLEKYYAGRITARYEAQRTAVQGIGRKEVFSYYMKILDRREYWNNIFGKFTNLYYKIYASIPHWQRGMNDSEVENMIEAGRKARIEKELREKEEQLQRLRNLDFSPFTFDPLPENLQRRNATEKNPSKYDMPKLRDLD